MASSNSQPVLREPISIIGMSYVFPDGASSDDIFWEMLMEKRNATTEFPKDRINIDAFHSAEQRRQGSIATRKANFLRKDISRFDASFFGISMQEAASMDPQHRILLETTYHALENAGLTLEDVAGSKASVHVGCFTTDYSSYLWRDAQQIPKYSATGGAASILSNRLSWFFDLRGSSMTIDTACSSSMVALDLACEGLWNGTSDLAIVCGANLIFSPELNIALSNMAFLSPDGKCFSFDHRANGYARGEGFAALVLKRQSDVNGGDSVRALIRSTATNEDGRTQGGITQPSKEMQIRLIREAYEKAGMDINCTTYFEAHGTGTSVGDPIEASAIGECFGRWRTPKNPLYVGSVKSNIGHLEGTSGLAGVVKTVLALEKATIPPNATLEQVNPAIDHEFYNIRFPMEPVSWPSPGTLRIASVNSFGFGGSNAHVILQRHDFEGTQNGFHAVVNRESHANGSHVSNGCPTGGNGDSAGETYPFHPRLLIYSASDTHGPTRQSELDSQYLARLSKEQFSNVLDDFSYTRNCRRSRLAWKSYAVVSSLSDVKNLKNLISEPERSSNENLNLGFVFTGQGAQWAGMGRELFQYMAFAESVKLSEKALVKQGCFWNLKDILRCDSTEASFDDPAYSQTLTTVVQIGLVDLLEAVGVRPYSVVGHSSGEIAAAYAAGHLSQESAVIVSYHRGQLASRLTAEATEKHTMMAVGLSAHETLNAALLFQNEHPDAGFVAKSVTISCINSPKSVTVSGPNSQLDLLSAGLKRTGVFHRKLRVGLGYHSPQMNAIAQEYSSRLRNLAPGTRKVRGTAMVSSVNNKIISTEVVCKDEYWVNNMILPVRFSDAIAASCSNLAPESDVKMLDLGHKNILHTDGFLEIGPHAALRAPTEESFTKALGNRKFLYSSALVRNHSAAETFLRAIGELICAGFKIDPYKITSLSAESLGSPSLLVNIPPYPFDHSVSHWEESRTNAEFRFRKHPPHDLIGTQIEHNSLESKWRLIVREDELPWIREHKVNGAISYPASGMLAMAIEATKQHLHDRLPIGFILEDVEFIAPIVISPESASSGVEVQITLASSSGSEVRTNADFRFRIFMVKARGSWEEVCRGNIRGDSGRIVSDVDQGRECAAALQKIRTDFNRALQLGGNRFSKDEFYQQIAQRTGLDYGPTFQLLQDITMPELGQSVALLQPHVAPCSPHVIHPTSLDGVFQLSFAALDMVNFSDFPTMVPSRLDRLWIAIEGAGHDGNGVIERVHTRGESLSSRTAVVNSVVLSGEEAKMQVQIEGLQLTAVSSPEKSKTLDDADHIGHHMIWNVDLDRMKGVEIGKYLEEGRDATNESREWADNMDLMLFSFAAMSLKEIQDMRRSITPPLQEYAKWLQERLDTFLSTTIHDGIHTTLHDKNRLHSLYPKVRPTAVADLYILVGENLTQILLGEIDPLALLFKDETLMSDFYRDLIHRSSALVPLGRYVNSLVHKWPALRFLEIGAGTGALSVTLLDIMNNNEAGTRYESYTFTDISPSFFEKAQTLLKCHEDRLHYNMLNIEEDPEAQGFSGQKYDVIVADNVFHATADLSVTLKNVKKLLNPGGKLLIKEMTTGMKVITGFFSGVLPGWWRSTEDYRIAQRSPVISEQQWDSLLKASGFSGTEFIVRDFADQRCHCWSFMVTTLMDVETNGIHSHNESSACQSPLIILDSTLPLQQQAAEIIGKELGVPQCNFRSHNEILPAEEASKQDYILLSPLDGNLFWELSPSFLKAMQNIMSNAAKVIWVTGGGGTAPASPNFGIANGLLRVIRQENNQVNLISVSLDIASSATSIGQSALRLIADVYKSKDLETEYLEMDGRLCINRLVTARAIDQHVFSQLERPIIMQQIGDKSLKLHVKVPGLLDTIEFREDIDVAQRPGPDEVLIAVKSIGIIFKDCLTMLGRVNSDIMGSEIAGVILEAGINTEFSVGDRVVACALDSYRTVLRMSKEMVVKIPEHMSFNEAASYPTAFCTALYCLKHIARLRKDESVLIHAAAGGTGQAAVQIALHAGATVFATVGSLHKKTLLMERYKIPGDHIFYSRDDSFVYGVTRMTGGKGVDVVLNSTSGRLLESTWNVVAPFGRFVEIGRKDVDTHGKLSMYPFIRNLTFTCVDLTMVLQQNVQLTRQLLREVMEMSRSGEICPIDPIQSFNIPDAENAFRFMQSGKSSGKIVLEIDKSHFLPIIRAGTPEYMFSKDASYVVAGGLGGIGRRITNWLVERGARNVIILSRSGGEGSSRATQLVETLRAAGVNIRLPKCDISDTCSLQQALDSCNDMPIIRGCFHAAMAISDSTFDRLTIENWRECTSSKVQGSWNLHSILPSGMDFFIMLSSACGIFGNAGQGSYASGNTYLDALARYRVSIGEKAIALDLGILLEEGYVANTENVMTKLMRLHLLAPMALDKLFAIFDYYCNTNTAYSVQESQICMGFELPADTKRRGRDVHTTMTTPQFRHMHQIQSSDQLRLTSNTQTKNFRNLFIEAPSMTEARELATQALQVKMSRILGLPLTTIELDNSLDSYGVDSLVALELRNWMTKEMGAEVAVFELLGGTSIREIGGIVAAKSTLKRKS
ncbi:reducing type I polyketide synthase [Periconia macrospinosa]|uniref:Reducing type I polyketide synthase n=1 Tax=Periconia macrospinosa TaxID=97972 RepID=A0A2V1D5V8_9PLEO|nr:reducing type I polyketide synthase [Periconia macrospinosa]